MSRRCARFPTSVAVLCCGLFFSASALPTSSEIAKMTEDDKRPEFLKEGLPIDDRTLNLTKHRRELYQRAIEKFQTTAACTTSRGKPSTEFSLDFDSITSLEEMEVCLFLVAAQASTAESIQAALRNSGFTVHESIKYPASAMGHFRSEGDGLLIDATLEIDKVPRSLLSVPDWFFPPYSLSVGVLLSATGRPTTVSPSLTRK